MKKILFFILLLIIGCASVPDKQAITLSDLKSDFPNLSLVSMKPIQTFDILPIVYGFIVKDSLMFALEDSNDNAGHCYSINSGKPISVILGRGNAANEFDLIPYMSFIFNTDSIQFFDPNSGRMKIFSSNDIATKPMNERTFSTVKIPNFHLVNKFSRIGENSYIGSYRYPTEENNNKYFIYDKKDLTSFGDFEKELFDTDIEINNNMIEPAFNPWFARYGDKVVTVNEDGILLQIIDLNKKTIEKKKYYNKIKIEKNKQGDKGRFSPNEYCSWNLRCDSKHIYFELTRRDDEKTKETGERISEKYILVFDWDLNPVKKYDLGTFELTKNRYYFSEDGKTFYYLTVNDGEEKHVLYEGKID